MPKIRKNAKGQYSIDESELVELVKRNPVLYASNSQNNDEFEDVWEEISEKLDAPVNVVKRKWFHIKESCCRRKSLRSVHDLNFLPLASLDLSNDNSCASSNCSSPKGAGKRSTRSLSQLSTASETENTGSTLPSGSGLKQIDRRSRSRMSTTSQKDGGSINETQSVESGIRRFQDRKPSVKDIPRPALSGSLFRSSSDVLENDVSTAARLPSDVSSGKNEAKKFNAADYTRAFFESMAMTVSTFPQHIQATLKIQICNLVGDAEYGLTIPKPR